MIFPGIVELVIVIAVIGVLAAILIPTFVGLVNRANVAADGTLVRELNNAIRAKAQLENTTVTDLIRRAICEYLNRDINVSNEILGTLEQINKNVKN